MSQLGDAYRYAGRVKPWWRKIQRAEERRKQAEEQDQQQEQDAEDSE